MAERRERITDLRALGSAFGMSPPPAQAEKPQVDFYKLPLLEQLRVCSNSEIRSKPFSERREKTAHAVAKSLQLDAKEKKKLGIHVIVFGDLDEEGKVKTDPEMVHNKILVRFPANHRGNPRIIETTDLILADLEPHSIEHLMSGADIVRNKTIAEKQDRLILAIKGCDTLISHQKQYVFSGKMTGDYAPLKRQVSTRHVSQVMDELNRKKTLLIRDFLQNALLLEEKSGIAPLFGWKKKDNLHGELQMRKTDDKNVLKRARNGNISELLVLNQRINTTNINLEALEGSYRAYLSAPEKAHSVQKAAYETYRILNGDNSQRRGEHIAPQSPQPQEKSILPNLDAFMQLPPEKQLNDALISRRKTAYGTLRRQLADTKTDIAVRSVLTAAEVDHAKIIAIAPYDAEGKFRIPDSEHSQYEVVVVFPFKDKMLFLKTMRGGVAYPFGEVPQENDEQLQLVDSLIQEKAEMYPEQPFESYRRNVVEITIVNTVLEALMKNRKRSDDRFFAAQSDEIGKVQSTKRILVASYLTQADLLAEEFASPLYTFSTRRKADEVYIKVHMQQLGLHRSSDYFLGRTRDMQCDLSPEAIKNTTLRLSQLQEKAAAFHSGDRLEANQAASLIVDKLRDTGTIA